MQATLASYPVHLVEALREQIVSVAVSGLQREALSSGLAADGRREEKKMLRVAVLSDMNGSYGSTTYRKEVQRAVTMVTDELDVELVLSTGDMVAGMKPGLEYEKMWLAFHQAGDERRGLVTAPFPLTTQRLQEIAALFKAGKYASFKQYISRVLSVSKFPGRGH